MSIRLEIPRKGNRNPELAAAAVRGALSEAGLVAQDLSYLIGHTATPARLIPPNIGQVAGLLGFDGPFVEFRQACTGFANALVFAQGLLRAGAGPVAIVGSETGSVFFDPLRAAEDAGQLVNLVQMGDGAAAIILAHDDEGAGARLSHVFYGQIGRGREIVHRQSCCGEPAEVRCRDFRAAKNEGRGHERAERKDRRLEAGLVTTSFRIKPTAAWIAFWRRHSALRESGSSLRQIGWEIQDRRPSGSPSLN